MLLGVLALSPLASASATFSLVSQGNKCLFYGTVGAGCKCGWGPDDLNHQIKGGPFDCDGIDGQVNKLINSGKAKNSM